MDAARASLERAPRAHLRVAAAPPRLRVIDGQRRAGTYAADMTRDQRQELADRLFAEHIYYVDFIRGSIGLMAMLPILYGILTWVIGDELWSGSEVYRTALSVPGAPQSWGSLFLVAGVALMASAVKRRYKVVMVVTLFIALVLATFMVMFGTEYAQSGNESALPPAVVWGVFSLLFLNLWRLASKMRKLERLPRQDD